MQSLKSTFVAVVLLGLSFGLYQLSETPVQSVDESLIPAMDISEGLDELAASGINQVDAFAEAASQTLTPPQLVKSGKLPDLQQPTTQPDFAVVPAKPSNPLNTNLELVPPKKPDSARVPIPAKNNVQSFTYPELAGPSESAASDFVASERKIIGKQDDKGLISALKNQLDSQQFVSTAQPIAAADTSVTQLAGSERVSLSDIDREVRLAGSEPDLSTISIAAAWPQVDKLVAEERYREALQLLSRFYRTEKVAGPQRQRLLGWLDALAGKVIFSAEHHLQQKPYAVGPNESLTDIAARWQVPAQLIYNVNRSQLPNPASLAPGTPLKVIDRPLDARIDLDTNIMTLFLGDLYAGRYPVQIGVSGDPKPGEYQLVAKSAEGFQWRDASGKSYPPEAPENGYGPNWMGLSGSLCIHALKDGATAGHHGCIGLSKKDAVDVFNILSKASTVTIVR